MNPFFVCENEGEYYLIQKNSPNWVLKVMPFFNKREIDEFCRQTGANLYSKQIEGYYVLVVFMNELPALKKEEFKYYNKPFPENLVKPFNELFKQFLNGYWMINIRKFSKYKILPKNL